MKQTLLALGLFAFGFLSICNSAIADDQQVDILDRPDYVPGVPYYQVMPPKWGFGLRAAVSKFPTASSLGSIYEFFAERQLGYQKLGIFSLGAHIGVAPFSTSHYENLKYGGLIRYQMHYFRNQIIVPTIALLYDGFLLKNDSNRYESTKGSGFFQFGALLNLGFFDSYTARQSHESMGLLRSYLTLEFRPLKIQSSALSVSGTLWLMGIRLETE